MSNQRMRIGKKYECGMVIVGKQVGLSISDSADLLGFFAVCRFLAVLWAKMHF